MNGLRSWPISSRQTWYPAISGRNFRRDWNSCESLRNSKLVRILIVVLTYATAAFLSQYLSPTGSEFVSWWKGGPGFRTFSLAGTWAFFVSYPVLVYFTYLWIWRQFLWARFLRSTTQLQLNLWPPIPITWEAWDFSRLGVRPDSLQFLPGGRTGWRDR